MSVFIDSKNMAKLLTSENLAKENFEKRKKAFLAEVDLLGTKYEIFVSAFLEQQVATDKESNQQTLVYVPKINIQDRKNLPTQSPDEPKKEQEAPKGTNDTPKSS